HLRDVPVAGPSARRPRINRPILESRHRQRPFAPQPPEHVPAELRVPSHPRVHPHMHRKLATRGRAGANGVNRPMGGRQDVRERLVERMVPPHQTIEAVEAEAAEPGPKDEEVVAGDDVRGIELQVSEMRDRLQDRGRCRARQSVEKLRVDREAARLGERDPLDGYATGTCGCFSGATERKLFTSSSNSGESYDSICPTSERCAITGSIGSLPMRGAFDALTR